MQGKGLVLRTRSDSDRRSVLIALSERGRALIDEVYPLHIANEARLLGSPTASADQIRWWRWPGGAASVQVERPK